MIKALISDFSQVLLFPKDVTYHSGLNKLHKELSYKPQYNPLDHFVFNQELLEFYTSLKPKLSLYIFTSGTIQDAPEFQKILIPIFSKIYSASKMGVSKTDPKAYKALTEDIGIAQEEAIYVDDSSANIDASNTAGLNSLMYTTNKRIIATIQKILI